MNLNPFEKDIVKLLAKGYSQKEIAVKYNVSKTNINNFLSRARRKTGMKSTIQLAVELSKLSDNE
jgi:DNA-binding NarL/FixJ family response regulator